MNNRGARGAGGDGNLLIDRALFLACRFTVLEALANWYVGMKELLCVSTFHELSFFAWELYGSGGGISDHANATNPHF